jgi:hypothetical protein
MIELAGPAAVSSIITQASYTSIMFTLRRVPAHTRTLPRNTRMFALYSPLRYEHTPTFVYQRDLPKLPVPKLRSTLNRYLKSLEPIIAEASGSNATVEMQRRVKMAEEFENGIGRLAQARLIGEQTSTSIVLG